MLDILLVKKVSRTRIAQVVNKYKAGQYAQYPHLATHFRTNSLKISCDKPVPINLDGEVRVAQEVEISLAKEKLRFFYPKGLHYRAEAPVRSK